MKAMLWKELRENFKWALIAMVGLALAEIYGLYYFDPFNYNDRGITLCNPTFLMATSFGNAIVGLLIGFVQILPEQRRDQWAALLHRPVSRAVIYRGKAIAGILLYLFATLPPFLLCFWLAATPGHFAEAFVPELALPGISDIFVGIAYYFAALTVALQRGSWFGARTLALLAAVYVSCSLASLHYFYVAIEAAVIMAVILFLASLGAMLSNGKFQDRPRLTQFGLIAAVFYGVCGLGILGTILTNATQQQQPYLGSQYQITMEGQPIVVTTNRDLTTTVKDLAGNVIHDDRYTGNRSYQNEIRLSELTTVLGDDHDFANGYNYYDYRRSGEYIQEINQFGQNLNPILWFYLEGPRYSIGIDRRSKAPSEIADRDGFKPVGSPIEPFTNSNSQWYDTPCLIQEGGDAFAYDLEKGKRTLYPTTDTSPIYGLQLLSFQPKGGNGYDQLAVIARGKSLQVYDSKQTLITSLTYDPQINLDRWGSVSFGTSNALDRFYVQYAPSGWISWEEKRHLPLYLREIDATGAVLRTYELPPLPEFSFPNTWGNYLSDGLRTPAFWFWTLAYQKMGAAMGIKHLANDADYSNPGRWHHVQAISIRVILFSLPCALLAFGWARRAGMAWRRAWAWAVFVFAFNLAGLITFCLVADWPVSVPCPACGRKRLVEETTCPHCQAGWPLPAPKGIEIFDDNAPAAIAAQV